MEEEECDFDAEISVTLVDNDTIRSINKEQRDIDRATDVLSFPMLEFDEDGIRTMSTIWTVTCDAW